MQICIASVMELGDISVLKTEIRKGVRVRVPPFAPTYIHIVSSPGGVIGSHECLKNIYRKV